MQECGYGSRIADLVMPCHMQSRLAAGLSLPVWSNKPASITGMIRDLWQERISLNGRGLQAGIWFWRASEAAASHCRASAVCCMSGLGIRSALYAPPPPTHTRIMWALSQFSRRPAAATVCSYCVAVAKSLFMLLAARRCRTLSTDTDRQCRACC